MALRKCCIALILLVFSVSILHSRENRTEMYVNFRVNSVVIDTSYLDNASRAKEIVSFLRSIRQNPSVELLEVAFCGAASPEGSDELNSDLARERLSALEKLVRSQIDIPERLITRNDRYIPWNYLKAEVEKSDLKYRDEILRILNEEPVMVKHHHPNRKVDHRVLKLKQLDRGSAWLELYQQYFAHMRNAYVVFVTSEKVAYDSYEDNTVLIPESIEDLYDFVYPKKEKKTRTRKIRPGGGRIIARESSDNRLYLKSNAIALGLGIVNAAVEVDVAQHLSITVPVYYSAWNYFKSTVKFRCLQFQPELRYWVDEQKTGFFAGAHLGVSSYNFAFGGDYRFQDHDGVTPAIGGGVSLGYRIPISKDSRWLVEFALGAGAYSLNFDMFRNTLNVKDGELVSTHRMTHVGLDQAQITFSYAFDLKRKGGKR